MALSAVCDCGISVSYSLTILSVQLSAKSYKYMYIETICDTFVLFNGLKNN